MKELRTIVALAAVLPAISCVHLPSIGNGAASAPPPRLNIGSERSVPETGPAGRRQPAAAYGGGAYLLVWREGFSGHAGQSDILALRVGPDGKPLDASPIPVCTDPGVQDMPAVGTARRTQRVP